MGSKRGFGVWISLVVVSSVLAFAGVVRADVTAVAYWNFDEAAGATTLLDSIGPADAVAGGTNLPIAGEVGILNGAWSFDGSNDNRLAVDGTGGIDNAAFVGLGLPDGFSYSGWVNTTTADTDTVFSISDAAAGSEEAALRIIAGIPNFMGRHNSLDNVDISSVASIADGEWHHLAVTSDSTGTILYVDGFPEASSVYGVDIATFTTNPGNVSVNFGANNDNGGGLQWEYSGLIDEFGVYEGKLSVAEVGYLAANPGAIVPEPCSMLLLGLGGLLVIRRSK